MIAAVRQLVLIANDDVIAGILNRNGLMTGYGNRWTRERVTSRGRTHRIAVLQARRGRDRTVAQPEQRREASADCAQNASTCCGGRRDQTIHPLPDGPWIFARAELTTSAARSITERARQNPRYPAGSHPRQQSLFSSIT